MTAINSQTEAYLEFRNSIENLSTPELKDLSYVFMGDKARSHMSLVALEICSIAFLAMGALTGSLLISGLSFLSLATIAVCHYQRSNKDNLKQKVFEDLFHEREIEVIFECKLGGLGGHEVTHIDLKPPDKE